MDTLDMVCDKVYCELDEINKKEKWDSKDVELIGEFVDILKDIDQIGIGQDGGGYSQMGSGSYMRGRSGRTMPMYGRSRGRSMSNGYSRAESKDMMLDRLQDVMDMAVDEKDRKAIERLMSQMEQN